MVPKRASYTPGVGAASCASLSAFRRCPNLDRMRGKRCGRSQDVGRMRRCTRGQKAAVEDADEIAVAIFGVDDGVERSGRSGRG